ncbi:TPA: hypothetical protein SE600_001357 [Campylobacter jejuni]|nr:hypothetical protein [Campylobacter jejuni]HEG6463077.1 hypothetical protein [Campylobacter jejuni]HEG8361648.1 hypothetical protein [Campylobacter jejuni]
MGGDLSIILSPKITLDLGAEQRFQMKQKINGYQNSEARSIPTLSLGSTYSINSVLLMLVLEEALLLLIAYLG